MSMIIADTETDALHGRAIEYAWIGLNPSLGITAEFLQRYNPERPIDAGATAIHHITDADVVGKASYKEVSVPDGTEYIIGHNIDYDIGVLELSGLDMSKYKRICTLALARKAFPEFKRHTITALIEALSDTPEEAAELLLNAHSALADVKMTLIILKHCLKKMGLGNNPQLIWIASEAARIPTHMPFGKHKGVPMAKLDQGYIDWALDNMTNIDQYLRKALVSAQVVKS